MKEEIVKILEEKHGCSCPNADVVANDIMKVFRNKLLKIKWESDEKEDVFTHSDYMNDALIKLIGQL